MRRRSLLVGSATVLAPFVAGCGGDGDNGETPTPGEFTAIISFTDCTTVIVDADEYTAVGLSLKNGTTVIHENDYSGEETFEASGVINEIIVWGPGGKESAFQSDVENCTD